MNDLDNLRKMLDSKNILYETNQFNNQTTIGIRRGATNYAVVFTFDSYGKFVDVGAYEV